jgi:hypothetical protein
MTKGRSPEGDDSPPPRSLRGHRQRTERNLVIAGFAVLFLVGGGLVWARYGRGAALTSWACMAGGLALFGLVYLIVKLMEIWVRRHE